MPSAHVHATLPPAPNAGLPRSAKGAHRALSADVRTTLQPFIDRGVIAGAVAVVATTDATLAWEALGYADLETRTPMQCDTVFWVASMTKPITAAAIMSLVDEGRLRLEDPVAQYWPEYDSLRLLDAEGKSRRPSRSATIRELLCHTAGLCFLPARERQLLDAAPLAATVAAHLAEPLVTEPGVAYRYSNVGIDIAGYLVERLSGLAFEDFLTHRFFAPLGMHDTTFFPSSAQLARLARAYRVTPAGLKAHAIPFLTHPLDGPARYPAPGGGLFSTAADLLRFGQLLVAGGTWGGRTYLSTAAVREMTRKQTPPHIETEYGLGLGASPDGRAFGHGGAYKTRLAINNGVIRVFLTQRADDWTDDNPDRAFADCVRRVLGETGASLEPGAGGTLPPTT